MEEENVESVISESKFIELLAATRNKDPQATVELLQLFNSDIRRLSQFIYLPPEDAASEIIIEFLEFLHSED
ncbi:MULTISPECIES: hypothetical protein [unclassified Paenibacillus]|uniref:hypothetical protein n=1 Tax=unclassified Paenibacillus TaxID=185978 RepID=UPI000FE19896|nr:MULTISPECIES: hypothetical protein [unclassified Paenibacillus]MCM3175727.1 hypothetical protein [Paenibacillus sp. MER 99-2]